MKVLLDIKDNKAAFVMELLKNFSYVKTKQLTPEKAQFLEELAESVAYMQQVKKGKLKGRSAKELLDEL